MGRRGQGTTAAAAQKAAGVAGKSKGWWSRLPSKWLLAAAAAGLAAVAGWVLSKGSGADEGPSVDELVSRAEALWKEGRAGAAIDELVVAQRRDTGSTRPAELLDSFRTGFEGRKPRHLKSLLRMGMERLEMVLFDALHASGELPDRNLQLQLAKQKMMYHAPDDMAAARPQLASASSLLQQLLPQPGEEPMGGVGECHRLAGQMQRVLKSRDKLLRDLQSGVSPQELAKRLLPQPPFTSVDRRAGLTAAEYTEQYLKKGRPVIITDYAERVLQGGPWGWEELQKACGSMEVIISERLQEARHLWAGLSQATGNTSFAEWLDEVRSGRAPHEAYLMDWGLAERCDALLQHFAVPKYFVGDLWKRLPFNVSESEARDYFARHPSVFAGGAGSGGALHVDSYASTFWQLLLRGRKRWTLYALPNELRRTLLYAGVEHEIMPLVPLPGEAPVRPLPLLEVADAFKVVVEVEEGELIVVPHDVPHMVENVEPVLALSMNVLDGVAVSRAAEDMHARSCFTSDPSLRTNLDILSSEAAMAAAREAPEERDVPFSAYRSYGPLPSGSGMATA